MSLFKKPKKIQRRVFCADDDDDGDPEPPPPPIISQEREKKESKSVKITSLLSFADEEEDGEVFKVKKSSQSKRLAKKRDKEKRRVPDGDNNKFDNIIPEDNNHTENIEDKQKPKGRKKVTLEGLILSGREALAADGAGDVSPQSEVEEEEEDSRGFHRYRAESVRAALAGAPGLIPDAALIHAARKTRQQARELGGDFIPVQESVPGSRLIRDEDDDDDEDGRIVVRGLDLPSDKPKRGTAAATSDVELDSEAEEWEEQQMQKAMPAIVDITGEGCDVNPFSLAPPPVSAPSAPHMRALAPPGAPPPADAHQLRDALVKRLQELQIQRDETSSKLDEVRDRLLRAARTRETAAARCGQLDAAYKRAQAVRGYLTDLIECLDEKMPQLEALEARALAMHRRRCEFLMERRRVDVRDQAQDVLALAARPGSIKPIETEDKVRRAAEREGRRRARRLRREASPAAALGAPPRHREGDSSDDELPPHELHHYTTERESIRQLSQGVFSDALPAWRGVRGVCGRLARWRRRDPALYTDAYVADCLPRLLAPYVRQQLILWNPLADEDNEDYERMDWYKCLMMYGVRPEKGSSDSDSGDDSEVTSVTEQSVRDDLDLYLVPTIVSRVVLPKVTEIVEHAWDPMCVRACVRLRQLLVRLCTLPGVGPGGPAGAPGEGLQRLGAAATARIASSLNADVFLPALPPQIMDGPGGGGLFWRRCLGAGVRLVRATLALSAPPTLLHADPLVLKLIETLCCGAGASGGVHAAAACAALAAALPRAASLRAPALARLAALAAHALSRLQSDNPLHLKAMEQARAVIAEARALE